LKDGSPMKDNGFRFTAYFSAHLQMILRPLWSYGIRQRKMTFLKIKKIRRLKFIKSNNNFKIFLNVLLAKAYENQAVVSARDIHVSLSLFRWVGNFLHCVCVSSVFLFGPVSQKLGPWLPPPHLHLHDPIFTHLSSCWPVVSLFAPCRN